MKKYSNQDVYEKINAMAPFSTALSFDNVGLLVGSVEMPVEKVLLALDVTVPVLEEAVAKQVDLIVTHHPVIFNPMNRIPADSVPYRLIQAGISVISAHTNLDMAKGGVNDQLAQLLGLTNITGIAPESQQPWSKVMVFVPQSHLEVVYNAMSQAGGGTLGDYNGCAYLTQGEGRFVPLEGAQPFIGQIGVMEKTVEVRLEMVSPPDKLPSVLAAMKQAHPYEEVAYDVFHHYGIMEDLCLVRMGELPQAMEPADFAAHVKRSLGVGGLQYAPGSGPIQRVVVCGGSGADYMQAAKNHGAQALVTGESRMKEMLKAHDLGITLVDSGHFATENPVLPALLTYLADALPGLSLEIAQSNEDRIRYL